MFTELRSIGGMFWLSAVLTAIDIGLVWVRFEDVPDMAPIRSQWGALTIPWISLWIIPMFQHLADAPGKEAILSLPYNHFTFGVVRVIRVAFLYVFMFYVGWCALSLFLHLFDRWEWFDMVLPAVSIYFLAAFSFMIVVITRNIMYSYMIIGVFCIFQYITRGSALGPLYPFHWSFPNPTRTHEDNLFVLVCAGTIFITIGHIFFKNRAFMLRK